MWKKRYNCHFCNKNSFNVINYEKGWICKYCDQYNGFNIDGDYNVNIIQRFSPKKCNKKPNYVHNGPNPFKTQNIYNTNQFDQYRLLPTKSNVVLCYNCNQNQNRIQNILKSFDPKVS